MKPRSYLLMLTLVALAGCATEPTTVTTTTTTQEVTNGGPRAGSCSHPSAAAGPRGNSDRGTRTGLRLDNRQLAMDRHELCVGAGHVGSPPAAYRSLDRRPLGASLQRLGVGARPLAIAALNAIVCELGSPA